MSYNNSIPNVTDLLAISQQQILANFQAIYNAYNQNHAALGTDNQGKHNSLTFRSQSGDPATSASQVALYNKLVSSVPQLFFRPSSDGTAIQMTNSNSSVIINSTDYRQSSFLAGPFTIYTGFLGDGAGVANGTVVTLTPNTTLIYVGLTFVLRGTSLPSAVLSAIPTNITGNTFKVTHNLTGVTPNPIIYYMAIGK